MSRKENSWLRDALVYVGFRSLIATLDMFSGRAAQSIALQFGRFLYWVDPKHRRIATENLRRATPPVCTAEQIPDLVRATYQHIALSIVEMLRLWRTLKRQKLEDLVTLEGFEHFDAALKKGRGAIAVVAHAGNWEIAGVAVAMTGYPINSLARPIQNRFVNQYLMRFRTSTGHRIIPKYNAMRSMMETLTSNGILGIQTDQDARRHGVFPLFFGRPASTVRSPARLAFKYGTPIHPIEVYREGKRHVLRVHAPIDPAPFKDLPDGIERLTQAFTAKLEEFIRRHPSQWMWLHRRWKTKPEPSHQPSAFSPQHSSGS